MISFISYITWLEKESRFSENIHMKHEPFLLTVVEKNSGIGFFRDGHMTSILMQVKRWIEGESTNASDLNQMSVRSIRLTTEHLPVAIRPMPHNCSCRQALLIFFVRFLENGDKFRIQPQTLILRNVLVVLHDLALDCSTQCRLRYDKYVAWKINHWCEFSVVTVTQPHCQCHLGWKQQQTKTKTQMNEVKGFSNEFLVQFFVVF